MAGVGDSEEWVGEISAGDGSVDEWSRSIAVVGREVVMVVIRGLLLEELLSRIEYAHRNANYNS